MGMHPFFETNTALHRVNILQPVSKALCKCTCAVKYKLRCAGLCADSELAGTVQAQAANTTGPGETCLLTLYSLALAPEHKLQLGLNVCRYGSGWHSAKPSS